jgi:hypothetical protein
MLTSDRILRTRRSYHASQVLLSAVELGVFTELGKGPRTAHQLCRSLGLSERIAPQWLDALVALGFLDRDGTGDSAIYLNTREASYFLDRRSPAYMGAALEDAGRQIFVDWDHLMAALRTGDDPGAWAERSTGLERL